MEERKMYESDVQEHLQHEQQKEELQQQNALRKEWENQEFQDKHALAREIIVRTLRELNGYYIVETGHGFTRFVESRMKTPESICNKLRRKGYDVDFQTATEKLNDLSGVRCICYSVKEIYWIARQIGKIEEFHVLKVKDYVRKPKKNGYESYHIVLEVPVEIEDRSPEHHFGGKKSEHAHKKSECSHIEMVRVELQLRTMIMDAWAGMDNRVSYKNAKKVSPEMEHRIEKYAKIGRRLDKLIQNTLDDAKVSYVTS